MKLKDLKRGETFEHLGNKWIVLEHDDTGHTLVLSKEIIDYMPFDTETHNNWGTSSLRKYLNDDYLEKLCEGTEPEKLGISPYHLDLTADDGLKDYGITTDFIFLLTCDLYRKNRDIIEPIGKWWWLSTAYSACASWSCCSRHVDKDGSLNYYFACDGAGGVRPACYLNSNIPLKTDTLPEKSETPLEVIRLKVEVEDMRERLSEIEDELASIIGEGN